MKVIKYSSYTNIFSDLVTMVPIWLRHVIYNIYQFISSSSMQQKITIEEYFVGASSEQVGENSVQGNKLYDLSKSESRDIGGEK